MDNALDLKVGDIICDPDGIRFRVTVATVTGNKIDVAYVPVDGGDEITGTMDDSEYVEIIERDGKPFEGEPLTLEEIAAQETIDRILDSPTSDPSARDLAAAYEALETKGRI